MPREKMSNIALNTPSQTWKICSKKAVYTGLVGGLAGFYLLGEVGNAEVFGKNVMAATAVGTSCAIGSLVGDTISDSVISSMDQSYQMRQVESSLVKFSVSGLATVASLKIASDMDPSLVGFATGGISKMAGDSVYNNFDPALLGMLF